MLLIHCDPTIPHVHAHIHVVILVYIVYASLLFCAAWCQHIVDETFRSSVYTLDVPMSLSLTVSCVCFTGFIFSWVQPLFTKQIICPRAEKYVFFLIEFFFFP